MSKRQAPVVFTGSVYRNFLGHVIKSEMYFNKKDPYAMSYLRQFRYQFEGKNKQKTLHPNHDVKIQEIMGVNNHSYVQHTWLNDMTVKFYLHNTRNCVALMNERIKFFNDICDNQRQIEGNDDELEDEEKVLK